MNLVIDASNIKAGGGLTHLIEILRENIIKNSEFSKIFLWAPKATLDKIDDTEKIVKCEHKALEGRYMAVYLWRKRVLNSFVLEKQALLFIPGTGYSPVPFVTMCRNLLPLDVKELNRYFFSKMWLRLRVLRWMHIRSYKKAEGVIFLTQYCYDILPYEVKKSITDTKIIPHGLNRRFRNKFNHNPYLESFNRTRRFRLLYVSIIDVYKHQWEIAEAVLALNKMGYFIELDLIGPSYGPALKKLSKVLDASDKELEVNYRGKVDYNELHSFYHQADAFIFGSSCETYGMVLTEAMAAGLPIICSEKSSMPETVGNAGIFFNPFSQHSIQKAIKVLYSDPDKRLELSQRALEASSKLSWERCASQTFDYLHKVADKICAE